MFLATPHNGSHLANLVKAFDVILRTTINVTELQANNSWLRELNSTYKQRVGNESIKIAAKVYYEGRDTLGYKVVDECSADPGLYNVMSVPVPYADHIQIAKPKCPEDVVYEGVRNFIEDNLPPQKFLPPADSNPIPELNSQQKIAPETVEAQPDNTQNTGAIANHIEKIGVVNSDTKIENQNITQNF
ncbi:MAG: hypothetical protein KME64_28665 [Scytonematopsis contorta HA4267-MV1]|nr:hypothetical protein [Scytonematopsis contorta HA4267-MV1]